MITRPRLICPWGVSRIENHVSARSIYAHRGKDDSINFVRQHSACWPLETSLVTGHSGVTLRSSPTARWRQRRRRALFMQSVTVNIAMAGNGQLLRAEDVLLRNYSLTHWLTVDEIVEFFIENPSQNYGESPAVWDYTVLTVTGHRWTRLAITLSRQPGMWFTYPERMKSWVVPGFGYIPRRFTCPQRVTHSSSNHLVATRPAVNPTTTRAQV